MTGEREECPMLVETVERLLRVDAERVPAPDLVTSEQWERWCNARGMRNLGHRGRRVLRPAMTGPAPQSH